VAVRRDLGQVFIRKDERSMSAATRAATPPPDRQQVGPDESASSVSVSGRAIQQLIPSRPLTAAEMMSRKLASSGPRATLGVGRMIAA